jgi:hypothetical protein
MTNSTNNPTSPTPRPRMPRTRTQESLAQYRRDLQAWQRENGRQTTRPRTRGGWAVGGRPVNESDADRAAEAAANR